MSDSLDRLLESIVRLIEFVAEIAFSIVRTVFYMTCMAVIAVTLLLAIGWALS